MELESDNLLYDSDDLESDNLLYDSDELIGDYPIVEDIDYDQNDFEDESEMKIKPRNRSSFVGSTSSEVETNNELEKYQQELQLSLAIRISLQTTSLLNGISEAIYKNVGGPIYNINDISDVVLIECAKRITNITYIFNLSVVNKHYNNTFKKNYDILVAPYMKMRTICFNKSLSYCKKMLDKNYELIKIITGIDTIIRTGKRGIELTPRIMSFRMVSMCNNKYKITKNNPIYIKILIRYDSSSEKYKSGNRAFYFYQTNTIDDINLKTGCPDPAAKEILC